MVRSGPRSATDSSSATTDVQLTAAAGVPGVFASYLWNNVAIALWFDAATVESIEALERNQKDHIQQFPTGMSSIHVMMPGGKSMPTAEARAAVARVAREHEQHRGVTVVVIRGTGFWASALRGMITAISMLAQSKIKPRICGDFSDVVDWLPAVHEQRTGVRIEAQGLLAALQCAERASLDAVA